MGYLKELTIALLKSIPTVHGLPTTGWCASPLRWAYRHFHSDLTRLVLGNRCADAVGGVFELLDMSRFAATLVARHPVSPFGAGRYHPEAS
ncbi:hypothetical protein AS9A_1738 [Hoyosella subflava DQS3-9A1]|uniref:Uncharacterized protein n=2 Tax=Hoyosella TaxID=697025 RepID=F6EKQ1_HOYSD|nr:hypothetical protein AS9A_1738 [Hoyosella subflava DQS3-9A1]